MTDRERGDEIPYGEPPMKIPEHMDSADLAPDDPYRFGIDFVCVDCGAKFWMGPGEYDGRWDHPPGEPRCPKCEATCPRCGGTGAIDAPTSDDDATCPDCDGLGEIE